MPRVLIAAISLAVMFLVGACNQWTPLPQTPSRYFTPTPTPVPACDAVFLEIGTFLPYAQATPVPSIPNTDPGAQIRGVVRTQAEWQELCRFMGQAPSTAPPVDLSTRMLAYGVFPYPICATVTDFTGYDCGPTGSTVHLHHTTYVNIRCITGPLGWVVRAYSVPQSPLPVTWDETYLSTTTTGFPPPGI